MLAQSPSPTPRAGLWWTAALILGLALACYWPALHGSLVWDDDAHVTRPGLRSFSGLLQIWTNLHATQQYYPLLHSAFWFEHGLWGDAPIGYHLTNVLLHSAAAFLLVLVLRRLRVPGAWLAGILFVVHPVCVESVAWISEQKNTLSLVFYLLAALAYLGFDGARGRPHARRAYLLASALFACALLTKSVTATLPAALLVILWWRSGRLAWRRDVAPLAPWFAAALASGLFTSWVERTIGGAEGGEFSLTLVQRFLLAGRVVWFYLGKLAWPSDLAFIYPRWDVKSAAAGWTGYLVAAALVTAALWYLCRRTRGPLATWLFYVGSLFPALGFFNVYPFLFSYVADHFQYLASLGIFAAVAAGTVPPFASASANVRACGLALAGVVVAAFVLISNAQSQTYEDAGALYTATLERNPDCWMAHNNLGAWYKEQGQPDKAVAQYREALHLRKDYPQAHNNLGVWCEEKGDLEGAEAHFREAIRLKDNFPAAHNNLGSVLGLMPGRLDEAIAQFRQALRIQPEFAQAHVNLGTALLKTPGRLNEAIAQYQEAIAMDPGFAAAHASLGDAYATMTDHLDDAVSQYEEVLRLDPENAEVHNNLGLALNAQGRVPEALDQYKEALRLRPGFAEIRLNIAIALLGVPGGRMEAAQQLEAYLQVRPANDTTRQILAQIQQGQP
jgi:tetratricopeptide (TPR) repeat protein